MLKRGFTPRKQLRLDKRALYDYDGAKTLEPVT